MLNRRSFLQNAAALTVLSSLPARAGTRLPIRMAVEYNMLPEKLSILDRFQLAKDCGYQQIECPTTPNPADAQTMKSASEKVGLPIHSVMNMDHWKYPFTSADPAVVERSLEGARTSIHNAHLWGASTVLLVPGVVNAGTPYQDAYVRSQVAIRKLIPLAEELNVTLALEEVWNKFLLSPLEFARYIDEYNSPRVRAYFDVGNVVLYGYPQDWIRTLGKRIVKLHIKDFKFIRGKDGADSVARWVSPGDGDIDWMSIHAALGEIGYQGTATLELDPGDTDYLKDMRRRFDLILSGEMHPRA
ncbi:sugar phosphate isomerase/epimerase [Terriglobus roseus DSM 18391]|uniref:Sugar phosphate isomerase/epimerase n=1 Tax=Terriglobus roseus (strain DSM 18391 / NRRL B-41598 / KBS 63) TaxID=926566 RepID=I3ZLJ7_TERRK|nr:sugar phosphate isomerase/epimerase family protein [Terriglobus roseus]AFL90115.1 sugar phosphate isomerase/epimerase [Terriglobus roseus DSM 18391]